MTVFDKIDKALIDHARKYGDRVKPWYIVVGKTEIAEIAKEFESRPRFGFQGSEYKTPNRFFSFVGEHRIVAVPFETHFSLGFDPDVANYYDQTSPYWSSGK